MSIKHTSGPWHANKHRDLFYIYDETGHCVATQVDADVAPLIAAAPETAAERDQLKEINAEMLAALEAFVERYRPYGLPSEGGQRVYTLASVAVAKAKGETP